MPDTAFLIDTFSLMFQVFHAIPPMSSPSGLPTNAVFGFSRDLVTLLQNQRPTWLICAMESTGPGVREEFYPEYKAHRSEMPDDLQPQVPLLMEIISAFGVPIVQCGGWEADDVIATLTRQAVQRGEDVRIVTSDKDARQLLCPQVQMYNLRKNSYLDEAGLLEDWGIRPDQVVDFQSLVGDAVDNVPGVPLVGPKKAAALLQQFQTLEGVLSNADKAPGAKLKENLKQYAEQALLSRKLVLLNQNLDLSFDWDGHRHPQPDVPKLQDLFRKFGFRRLVEDVQQFAQTSGTPSAKTTVANRAGRSLFGDEVDRVDVPNGAISEEPETVETVPEKVTPLPQLTDRSWRVVASVDELSRLVSELKSQSRICLDLETTDLDPRLAKIVGWAICWDPGTAYYIPTLGPEGSAVIDEATVIDALRPILESPSLRLVNQNVKYDLMVLQWHGIHVSADCVDVDPMVADYLLDAGARSHGLDVLIQKYLGFQGIPIADLIGTGKNQKNMAQLPIDKVAEYATEDADVSLRIADMTSAKLREQELWDLYWNLERPIIPVLAEMEQFGIRVDTQELKRQSDDLAVRLADLMAEIHRIAGHEFNIDSPKQLQVVLFDELKLPVQRKTRTGASTDQDVLEELAQLHELPAKIIEHRHLSKLKGTYLDALPQLVNPLTGRVHTSFNQVVAATGRLSSSDPNLQNIPIRTSEGQRIRRAFIASSLAACTQASISKSTATPVHQKTEQRSLFDDDADSGPTSFNRTSAAPFVSEADETAEWQLLCADYSQIELRVLAHFSQDQELIAAFEQGIDIHAAVAAQVFGISRTEISAEQRRIAKAVNFGVIYGQTAFGLAAALGISKEDAGAFIDGYFAKYSGVTQFIEETLSEVRSRGYAKTILGRRRAIDGIRAVRKRNLNMPERTAVNTVIQGSAADLIKQAMLNVRARMRRENHPGRMLLQIHDELVFETPVTKMTALAELVREEMQNAMTLSVPLVVDVSVGTNWLDTQTLD